MKTVNKAFPRLSFLIAYLLAITFYQVVSYTNTSLTIDFTKLISYYTIKVKNLVIGW